MPWYNGEQATAHLRSFLGAYYLVSEEPAFKALWRSYNECQFVDDEGDIVFYRNKQGASVAIPPRDCSSEQTDSDCKALCS
ncbi:hypothetical protein EVG20_g6797 [Dentipellis fragilis]|uniref:Uncharacterized protein n=1 Tax=Dentipellis fragilis TaxID=205917 RepID=A0A4Y9YKM3_9AGAM|nr:hypothetical protein EVG20_g6797 [Dentipellis fragilis]